IFTAPKTSVLWKHNAPRDSSAQRTVTPSVWRDPSAGARLRSPGPNECASAGGNRADEHGGGCSAGKCPCPCSRLVLLSIGLWSAWPNRCQDTLVTPASPRAGSYQDTHLTHATEDPLVGRGASLVPRPV